MGYIECFKKIRENYIPCDLENPCIKTLIIGESPPTPKSGRKECDSLRFFYNKNTGLFRYTRQAFSIAFPKQWENDEQFLHFFKNRGYYLIDLCDEPVNKKTDADRQISRKKGEIKLHEKISKYHPENIVVVMKGIKGNVDSVIAKIPSMNFDIDKNYFILPFPSHRQGRIAEYEIKLSEFIKTHPQH
jgi:hypothetical protein